jgi:hypothetical protein
MGWVDVRRVLPPSQAALAEVGQHFPAGDGEQGPDDVAGARAHAGEASRAGAPQEPEQQRLGLVVPGVRDRQRNGRFLLTDAPQEGVALPAGRLL